MLAVLGGLLALGGVYVLGQGAPEAAVGAWVLGGGLVLAYFSTRRHVVSIASDGGARLQFETKGMKRETVQAFVDAVESAKDRRVRFLSGRGQ